MSDTKQTPTIDQVVERYVNLRDDIAQKKADFEAAIAPLKAALEKIETYLLGRANELGVDSFKTPHGTAYTSVRTSVKVADKEAFLNFCKSKDEFGLMEVRASKVAIEQYVASQEETPPGIDIVTERTLNVRRS